MASDSKSVTSPSWSAGILPFGLIFRNSGLCASVRKWVDELVGGADLLERPQNPPPRDIGTP